jgi:hypothetical protein
MLLNLCLTYCRLPYLCPKTAAAVALQASASRLRTDTSAATAASTDTAAGLRWPSAVWNPQLLVALLVQLNYNHCK